MSVRQRAMALPDFGPTERAGTAQGHPRSIFKRAIERGNVVVAEATAREIGLLALSALADLRAGEREAAAKMLTELVRRPP